MTNVIERLIERINWTKRLYEKVIVEYEEFSLPRVFLAGILVGLDLGRSIAIDVEQEEEEV